MKKTTHRAVFLSLLLASCFLLLSVHSVHAQGSASISGDDLCGATAATKCTFANVKTIAQKMLYTFIAIGSVAMFIFIAYRIIQFRFAAMRSNSGDIKTTGENLFGAIVGFFIVVAAGGLFIYALKLIGAQSWTTQLLQLISDAFIPHAYAADQKLLPNPLSSNNLFDLIMSIMNLVIKFFIYPAIIVLWVWSGFQFVFSQGNPAGLSKAKSWLLWTVIVTVVVFTLQGFLIAFKNTALQIAPNNPAVMQQDAQQPPTQPTVTRDPSAPADGAPGSACTTDSGLEGIKGTDGSCTSRTSSNANQSVTNCTGQKDGTACTVSGRAGTCTMSDTGVYGCYATPVASTGGRTLVGLGGSCQYDVQCEGALHCLNSVCK